MAERLTFLVNIIFPWQLVVGKIRPDIFLTVKTGVKWELQGLECFLILKLDMGWVIVNIWESQGCARFAEILVSARFCRVCAR